MAASPAGNALTDYVARLIALRQMYPVLRSAVFLHGSVQPAPGILDIAWFDQDGQTISAEAWNDPNHRTLVLRRAMSGTDGKATILTLLLNPTSESRHFRLPAPRSAATLLFSQGTPMMLGGDEFARTQHGNNNAYCQDNEISWIDWTMASSPEGNALTDYVARLIALRHTYPVLRSPVFLHGSVQPAPGILDIAWFDQDGQIISAEAWNDPDQRTLVLRRAASGTDGKVTILTLLLNPTDESRHFRLPAPHVAVRLLLDSASRELVERSYTGNEISVGAHSVVLMHSELEEAAG
jgi:pullulanase/glycogen debranching enzyme